MSSPLVPPRPSRSPPPVGASSPEHALAGDAPAIDVIDHEALLVALVLTPTLFARNRHFALYRDPAVQQARRRAAEIRALVGHLVGRGAEAAIVERRSIEADGSTYLAFRVPSIALRVDARLAPIEAAALDVAVARARDRAPPPAAFAIVDATLGRLWRSASGPRRLVARCTCLVPPGLRRPP